jgi:hypothetical protein
MGIRWAACAAALLAAGLRAQAPPAASACNNTPAYSPCELVFELGGADATAHPQPYLTVDLRIEFRSPRRRTLAMPAFWDGGRRMVVRFSPTEAGGWDYHVTSNVATWNDQTGSFTAAASESPGFLRAANAHHWAYTERNARGLDQAHLWMGATETGFAAMDEAAFRATAEARGAQKFTHLRGLALPAEGVKGAFSSSGLPDVAWFQRLDGRVRYLNQKGMTADLILAGTAADLAAAFPRPDQRRRFVRFMVARYAAFAVTWEAAGRFEDDLDARAQLAEIGAALKDLDPYQHPRTSGARQTSTPLLDDKWMDFASQGAFDDSLGAIEHQLYAVPFVNQGLGREGDIDADTFRHRLWNATMDGQYVTGGPALNSPGAKAMTAWFEFMSGTRYWELEPYFDVDGGRAVALEDIEYVVYVEKPGPVELTVEKHGYEVYWVNPIDGTATPLKKKFSGEHFTGEPPDRSHDWVLHVVREGQLQSMARSVKFSSREHDIVLQEVEANTAKVPFAIEQPNGNLPADKPVPYAAKLTRESRATRSMMWLWMGEVAASRQGRRVLATGQKGTFTLPPALVRELPADMHLRLYGMNANGKIYELDTAFGIAR